MHLATRSDLVWENYSCLLTPAWIPWAMSDFWRPLHTWDEKRIFGRTLGRYRTETDFRWHYNPCEINSSRRETGIRCQNRLKSCQKTVCANPVISGFQDTENNNWTSTRVKIPSARQIPLLNRQCSIQNIPKMELIHWNRGRRTILVPENPSEKCWLQDFDHEWDREKIESYGTVFELWSSKTTRPALPISISV